MIINGLPVITAQDQEEQQMADFSGD